MTDVIRRCSCGEPLLTKANKCNPCARVLRAAWLVKKRAEGLNPQELYNYKWRSDNPAKYLIQSAKSRAKKKGLEFNLEESDIIIPAVCPVLGIPLTMRIDGEKNSSPSLDRIDSSKGYIKGNVQVMSWRANNLKADGTLEEFVKLVEFLKHG